MPFVFVSGKRIKVVPSCYLPPQINMNYSWKTGFSLVLTFIVFLKCFSCLHFPLLHRYYSWDLAISSRVRRRKREKDMGCWRWKQNSGFSLDLTKTKLLALRSSPLGSTAVWRHSDPKSLSLSHVYLLPCNQGESKINLEKWGPG